MAWGRCCFVHIIPCRAQKSHKRVPCDPAARSTVCSIQWTCKRTFGRGAVMWGPGRSPGEIFWRFRPVLNEILSNLSGVFSCGCAHQRVEEPAVAPPTDPHTPHRTACTCNTLSPLAATHSGRCTPPLARRSALGQRAGGRARRTPAPRAALTAASRPTSSTAPRRQRAHGLRDAQHGDGVLLASAARYNCNTHVGELRREARAPAMRSRCNREVLGLAGGCGGGTCPRLQRTAPSLQLENVQHGRLPPA